MSTNAFSRSPDKKPFHSSGYAQAAHGDSLGSTSSQSYTQRQRIERNRRSIQAYRDSSVAKGGSHLRDELRQRMEHSEEAAADDDKKKKHGYHVSRQSYNAGDSSGESGNKDRRSSGVQKPPQSKQIQKAPRQSFREPPHRGFNPYG